MNTKFLQSLLSIALMFMAGYMSAQTILKEKIVYQDATGKEFFVNPDLLDFEDLGVGMLLNTKFVLLDNDLNVKYRTNLEYDEGNFEVANIGDKVVIVSATGKGQTAGLRAIKDIRITIIDGTGKATSRIVPLTSELTNITSCIVYNGHLWMMSYLNSEVRKYYTLDIDLDFNLKQVPLKLVGKQGTGAFSKNAWTFTIQDGEPIAYQFFLNEKGEMTFDIASLKEDGSVNEVSNYSMPLATMKLGIYLEPQIHFNRYTENFYVYGYGVQRNYQSNGVYLLQYDLKEKSPQSIAVYPFKEIMSLVSGLKLEGHGFPDQHVLNFSYHRGYNGYDIKTDHFVLTLWDDLGYFQLQLDSSGKIDHIDKLHIPGNSSLADPGYPQPKELSTIYNKSGAKDKPLIQMMKNEIAKKASTSEMVWSTIQRDGYDLLFMQKGKKINITAYKVKDN